MHLKNRVAFHREVRGLTQAQVARHMGVSITTIARWEMGMHVPSYEAMVRLARVLQCRPRDLWPWDCA